MSTDVYRLVVGLTEQSEFGCRFGWYFLILDVTALALHFEYERDRTLGDRLDSDQLPWETDW